MEKEDPDPTLNNELWDRKSGTEGPITVIDYMEIFIDCYNFVKTQRLKVGGQRLATDRRAGMNRKNFRRCSSLILEC